MIDDLKVIRKKYGEKMYHFCRESFPTLLEEPGKLSKLLSDNFHESHSLFDDIVANEKESEFKNFIYSLVDVENNNELVMIKTPEELMSSAGYVLVECYNEGDIQAFRKYYAPGEELCTFNGGRLNRCRVFFAVKKNVSDIKREDFKNPTRQDEYGTSVISIQFTKDGTNTLSIKNRYNHTVNNPDATFSNNLDNIIPGLTESFERYKGIIQRYKSQNFEIKGYVRANDGKYYKYNYEINNVYYCPDNIIIDHFNVKKYDKSRYLIIDYFIIDLSKDNKSISLYDRYLSDSFCDVIKDINKIEIDNIDSGKKITILGDFCRCLEIITDKDGKIISLKMNKIYDIGDKFLSYNTSLQKFTAENLTEVGDYFLYCNKFLQKFTVQNLTKVGDCFLFDNTSLQELYLPNLTKVGDGFLTGNISLQELYVPNLTEVGYMFLNYNTSLQELYVPNLTEVGGDFLSENTSLQKFTAPNLTKTGDGFLGSNTSLQELCVPNLTEVGDWFLYYNTSLQKLYVPNLTKAGDKFLYSNKSLQELYLPNLTEVGGKFLNNNKELRNKILSEIRKRNRRGRR